MPVSGKYLTPATVKALTTVGHEIVPARPGVTYYLEAIHVSKLADQFPFTVAGTSTGTSADTGWQDNAVFFCRYGNSTTATIVGLPGPAAKPLLTTTGTAAAFATYSGAVSLTAEANKPLVLFCSVPRGPSGGSFTIAGSSAAGVTVSVKYRSLPIALSGPFAFSE